MPKKGPSIINIVAAKIDPAEEAEFNNWYDEAHVPAVMAMKGVTGAVRYQLMSSAPEGGLDKYLAVYEFEDRGAYDAYRKSPDLAASRTEMETRWKGRSFAITLRSQYETLKTWNRSKTAPKLINIVAVECDPADEVMFNKWYDEVHVPLLFKFKGMTGVVRYRLQSSIPEGGQPRYLTVYEFKNEDAYNAYSKSPELAAGRAEMEQTWKGKRFDIKYRAQYEVLGTWKK